MKSHESEVMEKEEIKLVGFTITESLNHVLESKIVETLRRDLAKRIDEIKNRVGTGMYLNQIYPHDGEWTPDVPFEHVIAVEVSAFDHLPSGMISHTIAAGRYIKIMHKGPESQLGATYEYINSSFGIRPIDLEYWQDINDLDSEESRIDIYIPG
ncbi:GyrI-like domain-containing protein [Paenibacillus sp. 2TAB23]|uniref:GyrI-like domain-containing protein n=1 Tax=Paenibacillus sp. 2TAB23 TaxID=3233004 RepID=UPI003F9BC5F3